MTLDSIQANPSAVDTYLGVVRGVFKKALASLDRACPSDLAVRAAVLERLDFDFSDALPDDENFEAMHLALLPDMARAYVDFLVAKQIHLEKDEASE